MRITTTCERCSTSARDGCRYLIAVLAGWLTGECGGVDRADSRGSTFRIEGPPAIREEVSRVESESKSCEREAVENKEASN